MAKWKPTKAWARKAKKATEKLIAKYKGVATAGCPYCLVFRDFYENDSCEKCPWVVFIGKLCFEDPSYELHSRKQRLPRLYGWLRRFENIIKGGS